MRWHFRFLLSTVIPPLLALLSCAQNDPRSIASRLYRYGDKTKQLNGIYFVDTTYYANIQAAITDAGTTGAVIISPTYAGGDGYTNPNSIPVLDLRKTPTGSSNIKLLSDTQLPTISTAGKITGTALPNPQAGVLGGVKSLTCGGTDKLSAIGTGGLPVCTADQTAAGGTGITSLNGLVASTQTFANGTSGNSPAFSSVTSTHTLNIPLASAGGSVTAGLVSNAEYTTFIKTNPSATQTITNVGASVVPLKIVAAAAQSGNIFSAQDNTSAVGLVIPATGQAQFTVAGGTAPITVSNNILVTNLNADQVDGKHYIDINPMAAKGAMIQSADTQGTPTPLNPNVTTSTWVLTQNGTGSVANLAAWGPITASMLPAAAARTDVGNTFTTGKQDFGAATETLPDKLGALSQRPANCTLGSTFHTTDTHLTYRCDPVNTWILDGGGGGGALNSVTLPTTDFTSTGGTNPIFSWGGTNVTATPDSANTPNAIVKRDGTGNVILGDVTAKSVTTNGSGASAVDISTQACVPGGAAVARLMADTGNILKVSEGGTACVEVAKVTSSLGGDLNGSIQNGTVVAWQGRAVSNAAPNTNDTMQWTGSLWAPVAPPSAPVTSVFGRTGVVVAVTNDYTAALVTNAFDITAANDLTEIATPGTSPAAGKLRVYAKTSTEQICVKNSGATETCYAAGAGTQRLDQITDPTSSTTRSLGGFNWGLTQSANSTGDTFTLTGFNANSGSGALLKVTSGGTTDPYALISTINLNPAVVPVVFKSATTPTADQTEWLNSAGGIIALIGPSGRVAAGSFGSIDLTQNITYSAVDSNSSLTGSVTYRAGDQTANNASRNAEPLTIRAGDAQSSSGNAGSFTQRAGDLTNATSASGNAGDLTIRPGANLIGGGGPNGKLQINQTYVKGGTYTANTLQCYSATLTVSDCTATSSTNFVGIANGSSGAAAFVLTNGRLNIALDASVTVTAGWFVCSSATVANKGTAQSAACAAGRTIGIADTSSGGAVVTTEVQFVHY